MTDHIIKAAREAGFTLDPSFADTYVTGYEDELERFYAIAYKQGMEDAYDEVDKLPGDSLPNEFFRTKALQAIRAHAQNQPESIHDTVNV